MNKKNKVNMEKVFATIISLSIVIALVAGIVSVLKNNNNPENKRNFIDLNDMTGSIAEAESSQSVGDEYSSLQAKYDDSDIFSHIIPNDPIVKPDKSIEPTTKDAKTTADVANAETETDEVATEQDVAVNVEPNTEVNVEAEVQPQMEYDIEPAVDSQVEPQTDPQINIPADDELTQVENPNPLLAYHFSDESVLAWPANGDIILNYNMTNTVYFASLDAYKCNPAIVIKAPEGAAVIASADGIVSAVYETKETGLTMEISVGDGYVLTYGQLRDICFGVGNPVRRGDIIGSVAAPTAYYSVEGSNLYFKMTDSNGCVNPMDYLE